MVLIPTNSDGQMHKRTHARNTPRYNGLDKKCFASTMTVSSLSYGRMPHVCVRGVVGPGRNICLKHNRFLYRSMYLQPGACSIHFKKEKGDM